MCGGNSSRLFRCPMPFCAPRAVLSFPVRCYGIRVTTSAKAPAGREATVVSLMIGLKGRSRSVGRGAVWGFLIRRFTRLMIFRGASGALHFYRPRGAKQIYLEETCCRCAVEDLCELCGTLLEYGVWRARVTVYVLQCMLGRVAGCSHVAFYYTL